MARKKVSSVEPNARTELLRPREEAKALLQERMQKGQELKQTPINSGEALKAAQNEYEKWDAYNTQLLKQIFTTEEPADEYRRWAGPVPTLRLHGEPPLHDKATNLQQRLEDKIHRIDSMVERLDLIPLNILSQETMPTIGSNASRDTMTNTIFLVHGHNETWREMVARFLEHLDLRVIILHEQPNRGRTIIEKFEDHSQEADFAVILLTGDDRGGSKEQDPSTYLLRARQNVIAELGYFAGVVKRSRVCALYEEGVEIPSDFHGVLYIKLDADWKLLLARELKAAGCAVDLNKAMS